MIVSDHKGAPVTRRRWVAVALATLLVFLCQSFVTQTHLDLDQGIRSAALVGAAGAPAAKAGPSSPDLPVCPICREIAHAGSYLSAVPVAFHAPAPVAIWRVVLPSRALTLQQRAPAWRSRAPPLPLQA